MYKVFADGEILCSSEAEELALLDPIVNLEANCAGSFTFKMPPDHPFYNSLVFRQTLIDVYLDDELIFEGVPVSDSTDFYNVKTVECEGELSFLNDSIQGQEQYTNMSVSTLLEAYLQVHNDEVDTFKQFQLGMVTVAGGSSMLRYTNFQTTMQEISEDLVDNYGGYLRVRHDNGVRYLDYLEASPRTSTQVIQIGKNLMDLVQNTSTLDICTVLIPLGAKTGESQIEGLDERLTIESVNDGKNFIIGTGAAYFGYVWKTATWDDVTVPANLLTKAQAYLSDAQWANLVITATAYDLGLAVEDVQKFRVLDTIRVVSEPHGLDRNFMLTALQIDLNHPGSTTVTLGSEQTLSLSAQSAAMTTEINNQTSRVLTSAAVNARQILENATGGNIHFVYDEDGVCTEILIMDTNDISTATKIWRWNINGWGYSGDGGQTYSLAATMNGHIYADFIDTGMLKSGNNNANWWNMDSGEIRIGNNANIAGWTINGYALYKTTTLDGDGYQAGIQATQSPASGTAAFYIKNTTDNIFPFIVRYDGSLTATKATITGNITANSLTLGSGVTIPYSKVSNAPDLTVYVAKDGTIGRTPAKGVTGFTVSSGGLLQASNAVIYGTLYSSSGEIGGWTIGTNVIKKEPTIDNKNYNVGIYAPANPIATNAAFYVQNVTDDYYPFVVRYNGSLRAVGGGTIGAWTLTAGSSSSSSPSQGSLYSGMSSLNSTADGAYIGYDGIALGGGKFKVTRAGNLTATRADITGTIAMTGGSIDMSTSSDTDDTIKLNYSYLTSALAPLQLTLYNSNTKDRFRIQSGGMWLQHNVNSLTEAHDITKTVFNITEGNGLSFYNSNGTAASKFLQSGMFFYNASGDATSGYSPIGVSYYHSNGETAARFSSDGMYFYDTSGNAVAGYRSTGLWSPANGMTTWSDITTTADSHVNGSSYTIPSNGWYYLKGNFTSRGTYNLNYISIGLYASNIYLCNRLLYQYGSIVWSASSREEIVCLKYLTQGTTVYTRVRANASDAVIGTQIEYVKL